MIFSTYYDYNNTQTFLSYFWRLSHQGQGVQELSVTGILIIILQVVRLMVKGKVVNRWFQRGVQECKFHLSEGWI